MSATSSLPLLSWPVNSADPWRDLYADDTPGVVEVRLTAVPWQPRQDRGSRPAAA